MNVKWNELGPICAAGAVGGLVAWLIATSSAGALDRMWGATLLLSVLAGAVAGAVGVYMIANSNLAEFTKCLCFATLCGLAWKPVLNTGVGMVTSTNNQRSVNDARGKLDDAVKNAEADPAKLNLQSLKTSAIDVAQNMAQVTDKDARTAATASVASALNLMVLQKPAEAPMLLGDIARTARASGSHEIELLARDHLQKLILSHEPPAVQTAAQEQVTSLVK